jgi:hypothetical protein
MTEIKSISKTTLAKIIGAVYGVIGFFTSIVLALMVGGNIISQASFTGSGLSVFVFHFAAGILIGLLVFILCAAFGWLLGYALAVIYNFTARKIGGIKIEIEEKF